MEPVFFMHEQLENDRYHRFVSLLTRNDQALRRFVRTLVSTRDQMDEVVQDTALECWRKFADFEGDGTEKQPDEFIRWACVIARYKVLSRNRDKARDRLVFRDEIVSQLADLSLANLPDRDVEMQAVKDCLAEMDREPRRLLLSVYSPHDSIAKIARESDQRARGLYGRLNALRKLLLACVKRRLLELE